MDLWRRRTIYFATLLPLSSNGARTCSGVFGMEQKLMRYWLLWQAFVVSCALSGCSPAPVATYTERAEVVDLPSRQQSQLRGYLKMFFGTSGSPQCMSPTGEEPEFSPEASGDAVSLVEDDLPSGQAIENSDAVSSLEKATPDEQFPGLVEIPRKPHVPREQLLLGREVYLRHCVHCHGVTGDGQGPAAAYLNPLPRDYRAGKFKFISAARGSKPLRADLVRIIRYGAKGTSMPAFRWLPEADVQAVIQYVIMLSQRGEVELGLLYLAENDLSEDDDFDPESVQETVDDVQSSWKDAREKLVLPATPMTPYSEESALAGRRAFLARGCAKCHGADGRGRTQANVGKDDWGHEVKAADLTAGMLHGGRRPIDVYRRIWSGINGTPMPSFENALQETPETAWDLVHYIQSLAAGREVRLPPEEENQLLNPADAESTDDAANSN